ncbi:hypothetical protein STENM223S_10111 [Streptomyces tendae]
MVQVPVSSCTSVTHTRTSAKVAFVAEDVVPREASLSSSTSSARSSVASARSRSARVAAVQPGPLGGRVDAVLAEPLDGGERLVGVAREQTGPGSAEPQGQVADDVRRMGADDGPGPVVVQDGRRAGPGWRCALASYRRRSARCPPSGVSGTAGSVVTGRTSPRPSRLWVTAIWRQRGQAGDRWRR